MCINSNVKSLESKFGSICQLFDTLKKNNIYLDLFAIQETWKILDKASFNIPGYNLFTKTRKLGQGGGAAIYIRNAYNARVLDSLSFFIDNILESIAVEIEVPGKKKFIAVSLYRPNTHPTFTQSEQFEIFFANFSEQLNKLEDLNIPVYFFSDTNIDLLKYGKNQNSDTFFDLTLGSGFLHMITKATRVQGNSATLIDHIFSNDNLS